MFDLGYAWADDACMGLHRVTVTGVDDKSVWREHIAALAGMLDVLKVDRSMVEIGILLSKSREGRPRYPTRASVAMLHEQALTCGFHVSHHLCGEYARRAMRGEYTFPRFVPGAGRIQVNGKIPDGLEWVGGLTTLTGAEVILQSRDKGSFPDERSVSWLYDRSGGRGRSEANHPPPQTRCGYAGGLSADNVGALIASIGATDVDYWIDAEGRLREEPDRFSPKLAAEFIAEAVSASGRVAAPGSKV